MLPHAPLSTLNLTPLDLAELRSTVSILQHLHHRNKNQHRVAQWWKWFAMLRRCLAHIVRDAAFVEKGADAEEAPAVAGQKVDWAERLARGQRLRMERDGRRKRVEAEAGYLERELVPRCYRYLSFYVCPSERAIPSFDFVVLLSGFIDGGRHRAFSNLIGDTQFAALGLVLLAALARVRRVLGVEGSAGEADGDEIAAEEVGPDTAMELEEVDVGEVISREAVDEALGLGPSGSGKGREEAAMEKEVEGEGDGTALAVGRSRQRGTEVGDVVGVVSARTTRSSRPGPLPPVGWKGMEKMLLSPGSSPKAVLGAMKGTVAMELAQRSSLERKEGSSEPVEDTDTQLKKGSGKKKKSKTRRPGNEIDDLFKGLV